MKKYNSYRFVAIALLVAALYLPGRAAEIWIKPNINAPEIPHGELWPVALHQGHFAFALPDDFVSLTSARVWSASANRVARPR